jgi:opacity protein-like surface antigen
MKRTLLLLSIFFWMSTAAQAAVVYLKDGSQVRGTIVGGTARELQVHTPDGTLTIATDRIQRIDYAETAPAAAPAPTPTPSAPLTSTVEPLSYARRPAEPDPTRQYFSMALGVAAPLSRVDFGSTGGGTDANGGAGVLLGGQYLADVAPRLGLGMNFEYFHRGATGSQSLLPAATTDVNGNTMLLLATMKYSFTDRGLVRPYVMGGVGGNYTSTVIDATPNPGFGWDDTDTWETRTLVDDAHWGFASTARFGVDFSVADPTIFSLELGWTRLANATYAATPRGREVGLESVNGNQNVLAFAARWGWRF